MEPGKLLCWASAALLLVMLLGSTTALGTTDLCLTANFLGEPDVFVPGFGLEAEISLTRSLDVWASGAYFLSGTWDLETGLRWHLSQQLALSLQALLLFDVVDDFVPQLGAGVRPELSLNTNGLVDVLQRGRALRAPCGTLRAARLWGRAIAPLVLRASLGPPIAPFVTLPVEPHAVAIWLPIV